MNRFLLSVFVFALGIELGAHDPGLSSLDVQIANDRITALLTIAVVDAGPSVPSLTSDGQDEYLRRLIVLRIDGRELPGWVERVDVDDSGAARVRLSFVRPPGSELVVSSLVPSGAPVGHRELVTVSDTAGRTLARRLIDARSTDVVASLKAPAPVSAWSAAGRFVTLGFEHILSGYDHLLFLAALLLTVRKGRDLLVTVTAFTAAHSVTLALAALGLVRAPAAVVEPIIAASIAYVALENLWRSQQGSRPGPAFGFGLVHGLGFAGALQGLLPGSQAAEVVLPLLSFNLGVEAGQLAVAAAALPLVWAATSRPALARPLVPVCSVLVAAMGGYWFVERVLST